MRRDLAPTVATAGLSQLRTLLCKSSAPKKEDCVGWCTPVMLALRRPEDQEFKDMLGKEKTDPVARI